MASSVRENDPVVSAGPRVSDTSRSPRNVGRVLEQTWVWSVVGYTVVRFLVAWGAFSDHGVNVWIFGLLDVGTAWPYAKAIALVSKRSAHRQWRGVVAPVLVALVSFFLPYAYVWFAAGSMPTGLRIGLAIFVVVLFLAATGGVLSTSRKLRNAQATDEAVVAEKIIDETVIDLRDGHVDAADATTELRLPTSPATAR